METPLNLQEAAEKIWQHCWTYCTPYEFFGGKKFEECFVNCFDKKMKEVGL